MDSDIHTDSSSSLDESAESADEHDFSEACFKKRVLKLPECFCSEVSNIYQTCDFTFFNVIVQKRGKQLFFLEREQVDLS